MSGSLIDGDSCICTSNSTDLWAVNPTLTDIEQTRYLVFQPVSTNSYGSTLEFKLITGASDYMSLSESYLFLRAKITDGDGEDISATLTGTPAVLGDTAKVFPVANFLSSCFKQVEVSLENTSIGYSDTLYQYKAYFQNVLSYSASSSDEQLTLPFFYRDQNDGSTCLLDNVDATIYNNTSKNKGACQRFNLTKGSKSFEMLGRIHHNLFMQPKMIKGGLAVTVKLTPNSEKLCLMSANDNKTYRLIIEKAEFHVCAREVGSHIRQIHEERLKEHPMKYPLKRVEMKFFTKARGLSDLSVQSISTGDLIPCKCVIGLVSSDAFNGSYKKNPFNFKNFDIREICLRKDNTSIPSEPLTPDFDNDRYVRAYHSLMMGTHIFGKNESIGISYSDFGHGFTIFVFNLTQDGGSGENFGLIKSGTVSLSCSLNAASTESITIVCYLEFDRILEIDHNKTVTNN